MKLFADIFNKTWYTNSDTEVPFNKRNVIEVIVDNYEFLNNSLEELKISIFIIKNGIFYKHASFPEYGVSYVAGKNKEIIVISSDPKDSIQVYCLFTLKELSFYNLFNFIMLESTEITENLEPDLKIIAIKDHRKDNFKEAIKEQEKINSSPGTTKL